jgi:gliding motility-associated-like protein
MTDGNGCTIDTTAIIENIQALTITSILTTDVSCFGGQNGTADAQVSGASGTLTYNWSGGNSQQNSCSNLTAGNYVLEVSDGAGCIASKPFTISAASALNVQVSLESVSCAGLADGSASALVSGGNLPYTYSWDGVSGSDNFSGLNAGNHILTILDLNGCSTSESFQISEPEPLVGSITVDASSCGQANGAMAGNASGGTAPYNFLWNTGETTEQLAGLNAGSYTVSITDQNNCQVVVSESFTDLGSPQLSVTSLQNIRCNGGTNGTISVTTVGGTGEIGIYWNQLSTAEPTVSALSAGVYTAISTDAIGCRDTLSVTITEPDSLHITLNSSNVKCFGGSDGWIEASVTGGTQPYAYNWSSGNSLSGLNSSLEVGFYELVLTDINGCQQSASANIGQPQSLSMLINSSPVRCYGGTDGRLTAQITGGVAPYQCIWNNGSTRLINDSLAAGTYTITTTDSNGCVVGGLGTIRQPEPLQAYIGGNTSVCKGNSIRLQAAGSGGTGSYSFLWQDNSMAESISLIPDSTTTFSVNVRDSNGCADQVQHQVIVFELPPASLSSNQQTICAEQCIVLEASLVPGASFTWTDEKGTVVKGQTAKFCYDEPGKISLSFEVVDQNGCKNAWNGEDYILVNPNPVAAFEPENTKIPLLDALVHFDNNTSGEASYVWNFDAEHNGEESSDKNPSHLYTEIGEYLVTLTATNAYGCKDVISRVLSITEDFAVYIPSAFTPNADGKNDTFKPSGIGISESGYTLLIYNRLGELVFESNALTRGWNGDFPKNEANREVPSDVFVWKLMLHDFKGEAHEYIGSVTLIR